MNGTSTSSLRPSHLSYSWSVWIKATAIVLPGNDNPVFVLTSSHISSLFSSFCSCNMEIVVSPWCEALMTNIIMAVVWLGYSIVIPKLFPCLTLDKGICNASMLCGICWSLMAPLRLFCCVAWLSDPFFCFITAKCIYGGKVLAEGQRILTKSCRECRVSFNHKIPLTGGELQVDM